MIVSEADYAEMGSEKAVEYCNWCWGHDFGNCDLCAVSGHEAERKSKPDIMGGKE